MSHFPYRLAAVDLDETLLGHDKRISHANLHALRKLRARGVEVVLASGRRHANMVRFHEELGLRGWMISAQGALVKQAETGEVVYRAGVEPALAQEIVAEGLRRGMGLVVFRDGGVVADGPEMAWREYERLASDRVEVRAIATLAGEPLEKVIWIGREEEIAVLAGPMREAYGGRADVVITEPTFLEFTAHGVNKASALAALAHRVGVKREEVLAFGDGNNDVAMLRWAGMGVAMSHAKASAKAAADVVAGEGDVETSFARGVAAVFVGLGVGV